MMGSTAPIVRRPPAMTSVGFGVEVSVVTAVSVEDGVSVGRTAVSVEDGVSVGSTAMASAEVPVLGVA